MRKRTMSLLSIAILNFAYGQKDSLNQKNIEEVVVTGQYTPQSIKKSLYKVEVISSDDIKRMAVNNVAEVLNQTLNILIIPEKNTGDSKANIMGLGADYTKVLVDNIPVVGDTGLGSNIDLTKLSLDNIERIEIVKGSMGVEFGNNAVAGVINIITRKNSKKKWNIRGFVQEETVGKEYDWIDYGKGRHIQSLGISHNISEKWYADLSVNRNDFQGFWGRNEGKNYFQQDAKRGYEWQPKEQWNPTFMLRFSAPKTQFFYKADYLMEEINFYNPLLVPKDLGAGERTFTALDRDYFTQRMLHHFNIQTEFFKKTKFTADFSYQKQTREKEDYLFDVPGIQELSRENKSTYYQAETFYSRGTLSNFLNSNKSNLQLGYEGDYTKGFAGLEAGKFDNNNVVNNVLNLSVFASAEFDLSSNWFLRPGVRLNFSDTFETKPNFSLVLKKSINEQSEFRAIVGSANKNPTFEELFTYMVDSNHNIQGSSDLKPENSYSGMLYYSLFSKPNSQLKWSVDVSSLYLQTQDRIELAITSEVPLQYKYINVNSYESWLNTISGKVSNKNFGVNLGFSILGRMMDLNQVQDNKYQYSPEVNASAYYNLLQTKTSFAVYFKGVGRTYRIIEDKSLGVTQYIFGRQNAFSLMDASVSQKIWKDHFTLTVGVRNIFDISDVRNGASGSTGGAHASTGAAERMFYGRSFFGRFNFNF